MTNKRQAREAKKTDEKEVKIEVKVKNTDLQS